MPGAARARGHGSGHASARAIMRFGLMLIPGILLTSPCIAQMPATGFLDRELSVAGTTHRYQVYLPPDYNPARAWRVILFLHGAGERGADGILPTEVGIGTALRRHRERYPAIVVFPQAPLESRWSQTAEPIAMAALDSTMAQFHADSSRIYLAGLSLGGNGALALASRHPDRFAALVVICGWVTHIGRHPGIFPESHPDPHGELARRIAHLPIQVFHGDADPIVPVDQSRLLVAALQAAGADVQYTELPGVGHGAWDAAFQSTELPGWLLRQRRRSPGN